MGFFSSIWHAVSAPLSFAEQLVSDVTSGKNVFQSVTQTAEKSFISASGGLNAPIISSTPLAPALTKVSPLTFGVTGRIADNAELSDQVNSGKDVSFSEFRDFNEKNTENGAILGAAATGNVGLAAGLATGTQQLDRGNLVGGLAAIGAGAAAQGVLGDLGDSAYSTYTDGKGYFDDAKSLYDKFRSQLPAQVSGYSSNTPGGSSGGFSSASGSGGLFILAAAGAAAYFVLRGKK